MPKRGINMVLMGVAKSLTDLNIKSVNPEEQYCTVNELNDNVIARYPAIRVDEIPQAIANGIRGKYGEFFGLSVVMSNVLLSSTREAYTAALKGGPSTGAQKQSAVCISKCLALEAFFSHLIWMSWISV